jgi:hypothetical protein
MNPEDAHLTLVSFQMEDANGKPLTMSGDGVITELRGLWGRALRDGTVTFPDGSLRGRLLADGRVVDAHGVQLATIAADGTAKVKDVELRFDKEGRLVGGNPSQPFRLTAPNSEAIRTAMLVFLLTQLRPQQPP